MALDITGIDNVNEFYSQHYLEALLEGDVKALFGQWSAEADEGATPPDRAVRQLKKKFGELRAMADEATAGERREKLRAFHRSLLDALRWEPNEDGPQLLDVDEDEVVPLVVHVGREGTPHVFVIEADMPPTGDTALQAPLLSPGVILDDDETLCEGAIEDVLNRVFAVEKPPTWVVVLAGRQALLARRSRWGQGSYLSFDLDALFDLSDAGAMKAFAALLARDALAPGEGASVLHDVLDENSHKHAYGVSQDLKYGLREAVELLGNAWVKETRIAKKKVFDDDATSLFDDEVAQDMTRECLTFLYRLLFLFYAEARGEEVGVVPMKSEAYRLGYSLEHLRDLELVPLNGEEARTGTFIHDSIERLFRMLFEGYGPSAQTDALASAEHLFRIPALKAQLFKPEATKRLSSVRINNDTMQKVLQLLSLSRESGRGRRSKDRGRISYAQLGINQLGAVYEALLSYTGFFAPKGGLFELKPASQKGEADILTQVYFARADEVDRFEEDEFVLEEDEDNPGQMTRKFHPQGAFVYRLAGRDRIRSASYYTPEVLTQCVVKYSLKELLKDILEAPPEEETAHRILQLTVCEPAMGSGAFLNEAINQMADAYLQRRQLELGENIPAVDRLDDEGSVVERGYASEARRVRAYIATHNVYGVDLNPTAAELAKVSLWLNVLGPDTPVPWFDLHLAVGNSLFGCRRQVFREADVLRKGTKKVPNFLGLVPDAIPLSDALPNDGIFHWLLPDEGMAAVRKDKVAKGLAPKDIDRMKKWHKEFVKAAFTSAEVSTLKRLTQAADRLWKRHVEARKAARRESLPSLSVWGGPEGESESLPLGDLETIRDRLLTPTSAFRRLRLAMDAWCALWVWPVEQSEALPSRQDWLEGMAALLEGDADAVDGQKELDLNSPRPARQESLDVGPTETKSGQTSLVLATTARDSGAEAERHAKQLGLVDVDAILDAFPFFAAAADVATQQRFMHWELQFADLFQDAGGFDLIVGNPPWVKLEWEESGLLSEFDAVVGLRKISASDLSKKRKALLEKEKARGYLLELGATLGSKSYLNALQSYPLLKGVQTNLYKCFITRGWEIGSNGVGVTGFIHQEGLFDDPRGGEFRRAIYERAFWRFEFMNKLSLFQEVKDEKHYGLLVSSSSRRDRIEFAGLVNLFHPRTIDDSLLHLGSGQVPGIKNDEGNWDLRGHKSRVIEVDDQVLATFAQLYDEPGTPAAEARLPIVHSVEMLKVLKRFAALPKLGDIKDQWTSTEMWHETNQQKDGTIKRAEKDCESPADWIVSGPHFYVATPFNKTPNEGCRHNQDYSVIDLETIADDYLPRTLYQPACSPAEYLARTPKWNGRPVTDFYRHYHREMVAVTGERTLVGCLMPPGPAHVHTVMTTCFREQHDTVDFGALASTLLVDYLVRSFGKGHVNTDVLNRLPSGFSRLKEQARLRYLLLNCVSNHYAELWKELWNAEWKTDGLTKSDERLRESFGASKKWTLETPARSAIERRQMLLELDALAAVEVGLPVDDLCALQRVQFPVFDAYERETFYDSKGAIVFTINRGLTRVGLSRKDWEPIKHAQSVDELPEDIRKQGYLPPFDCPDREEDMRQAYAEFERRLAKDDRGAA